MEETNQAEKSPDQNTSFSQQSRSSKMIQAAAPYLDTGTRVALDMFVKVSDFMDVIHNFRQQGGLNLFGRKKVESNDNTVSATGLSGIQSLFGGGGGGGINFEGILKSIRPYCTPSEIPMVDNVLNIFNMKRFMEMYQNMSGMMNPGGTGNPSGNAGGMMNIPAMMNMMNMMNSMGGSPFGASSTGAPPQGTPPQGAAPSSSPPPGNHENTFYESTSPTPYDLLYQAMYGQGPPPEDSVKPQTAEGTGFPKSTNPSDQTTSYGQSSWPNYNTYNPVNLPPYQTGNTYQDVTSAPYYTSNNTPYRFTKSAADVARKGNYDKASKNAAKASAASTQTTNSNGAKSNNQQMFDMIASMVPPEQKNTFESMKKMFETGFMPT